VNVTNIEIHHQSLQKILDLGLDVTDTSGRVAHRDRGKLLAHIKWLEAWRDDAQLAQFRDGLEKHARA